MKSERWSAWFGVVMLAAFVACVTVMVYGADVEPGYTFTSGEKNITHTKLNNAAAGSINPTFYTDKTAVTTPAAADVLLLYSVANTGFRKITLDNLVFSNPLLISNRTEEAGIASNDFVLVFDTSASAERKARVDNLISNALARPGEIGATASNNATFNVLKSTTFTNSGAAQITGALTASNTLTVIQGLSARGALNVISNIASLRGHVDLGYSSGHDLTFNGTMKGTLQGTPVVSLTSVTIDRANDKVLIQDASDTNNLKIASIGNELTLFTTNGAFSAGKPIDVAHGLGGVPDSVQAWLHCTNASQSFSVGDKINLNVLVSSVYRPAGVVGKNATNVFVLILSTTAQILDKTGADATITAANFELVVDAIRRP